MPSDLRLYPLSALLFLFSLIYSQSLISFSLWTILLRRRNKTWPPCTKLVSLVFGLWVYLFTSIPLNLPLSSTFPHLSWHCFYVFFTLSFTSYQPSPLQRLLALLQLKRYPSPSMHPSLNNSLFYSPVSINVSMLVNFMLSSLHLFLLHSVLFKYGKSSFPGEVQTNHVKDSWIYRAVAHQPSFLFATTNLLYLCILPQ